MKYVPSLPSPIVGGVDRYQSRPLPRVQAMPPVQQRSLPPLIFQRRKRESAREIPSEMPERRHDPHVDGERRTYCRRTFNQPVLLELRSGTNRRRHTQRATDHAEHVDEEI